jgi:triacylglycerol lipase
MNPAIAAARCFGGTFRSVTDAVNPDVWRELFWISTQAYSLFIPRREQVVDKPADGRTPVVLVHGLGGNRGAWTPLKVFLRVHGHRRMYSFGYEGGTIEAHAERLVEFVKAVIEETGEPEIDLIGHSLGGLVSRYAIQRLGLAKKVRTLVTMATPHLGTFAAQYANTPLTLPLRPDSPILTDLNSQDMTKLSVKFVTIGSDTDIYVIPHENMMHPAARNVFVPSIAHSQHLASPAVFREVVKALTTTDTSG